MASPSPVPRGFVVNHGVKRVATSDAKPGPRSQMVDLAPLLWAAVDPANAESPLGPRRVERVRQDVHEDLRRLIGRATGSSRESGMESSRCRGPMASRSTISARAAR